MNNEIKNGTYLKIHEDHFKEYLFIKGSKAVVVHEATNNNKMVETGISVYYDESALLKLKTGLTSSMSISWNTFMEAYRRVLGQSDDILGTRGVLIKPEEINERLYVDDFDTIKIKY